jgi:hypothetical protein
VGDDVCATSFVNGRSGRRATAMGQKTLTRNRGIPVVIKVPISRLNHGLSQFLNVLIMIRLLLPAMQNLDLACISARMMSQTTNDAQHQTPIRRTVARLKTVTLGNCNGTGLPSVLFGRGGFKIK